MNHFDTRLYIISVIFGAQVRAQAKAIVNLDVHLIS